MMRRLQVPALVLLLSLVATSLVVAQLWRLTTAKDRERFESGVSRRQAAIDERLNVHIALLRGVAGLLAADSLVTVSQFHDYVARLHLPEEYPGLQGIGFTLRVAPADVEAVEEAAHQQGLTNFRIWPPEPREEYHTILYLEPLNARNRAALGFDMFTHPTRREAMERARDTGTAASSGRVRLVQEIFDDSQAGFLVYVPVYEGGGVPATVEERRAALIGFAYSPFRADDLFTGFFGFEPHPPIALEIYDSPTPAPDNLLHRSIPKDRQNREEPLLVATEQLEVAGRTWAVRYETLPGFQRVSGRGLVPLTAGTGLLVSLLLGGVTWRQVRAREVAELHRVTSVAAANRLRVALANAPVSVYTCDRELRYTWVQGRIASLTAGQLLGRRDDELFGKEGAVELLAFKRAALADGQASRRELRLTVAGEMAVFDFTAEPLRDRSGRVVGLTVAVVDLTQRVMAEDRAREEGETLTILNRLGASLASKLDLEELVQSATDAATMLTGARFGAFFYNVIDDQDRAYTLYTISGVPREHFSKFPMPRKTEVFGPTFAGQGIVRSDDITVDPRYGKNAPYAGMPEGHLPVKSYLAVPVLARAGEVLGGLFFGHPEPGIFSERDERIVVGIAAQAAIGIDNARLYEAEARAVRRLQESEERLHLAVAIAELGTFDIDLQTDNVTVNETGREIYGWPPDRQITFSAVQAHFHPADREGVMQEVGRALESGGPGEFEVEQRIIRTDGQERWLRVRGQAVFEQEGQPPVRCVGTYRDITEDRQAEQLRERALAAERAAREEAEHVGRLKDEFLATLSHELRTPLNAILGWAGILQEGSFAPDEVREGVEVIERNARAQAQLIEDLLDVSRIISGKLRIEVQPVDLPAVLDAALAAVQPAAEAREIRVERFIDPEPGLVSGDPARLQQIFWNLLSNAIKFTPRGGKVQVRLERVNAHIDVTVTDTGQGIKPEFLPHLFERFRQADASTTRRHGGLGLGLSIVKQLAEIHGGSVEAASGGVEQGASFVVSLPVSMPHPPAILGQTAQGLVQRSSSLGHRLCEREVLNGLRVLVVDDERDSRELVGRLLTRCGAAVTAAGSVDEALAIIDADPPQILIGDIGMPGRDGHELISEIRSRGHDAQSLPAIALTAFARPQDKARALEAGFQVHVAKPVDSGELIAIVASLSGRGDVGVAEVMSDE